MPDSNSTPIHPLPPEVQQALAQLLQAQKQWELKLQATNLSQHQTWLLGKMCYCRHQLWTVLSLEEQHAIHH